MKKDPKHMTPREQALYLDRTLGYEVLAPPPKLWLTTGSKRFNKVLGSEELGIAYGKTYTLAGQPSSGKSLIMTLLMGLAQADGAIAGLVDVEDSFDAEWAATQGCDPGTIYDDGTCENIAVFRPRLGIFGKKKKDNVKPQLRMQAAEELFDLAERWMIMQRQLNDSCKIYLGVDSTTAVEPIEELEAGLAGQNMRTKMLAPFLNRMTKRWNKVAANTNAIILYIAQLRTNPGQLFGNPEYIPGGAGVLYYPSSINKVRRARKGGLLYGPDNVPIGVASVIVNVKNKVGGGSVEGARCGFKAQFNEMNWKFMPASKLQKEMQGKKNGED